MTDRKSANASANDTFRLAEALYEAGDLEQAGRLWQSLHTESAARFNAGNAFRDAGDFESARSNYMAALALGEPDAYLNLASLYLDEDHVPEAHDILERGAEAGDAASAIQLALLLVDDDPQAARTLVEPYVSSTSVLGVRATLALARALHEIDPSDSGVDSLIESAKSFRETLIDVADLLADIGRQKQAVELYEQCLVAGEKEAGVPLGNLSLEAGDIDGAVRAYEAGARLGDNYARYNLGLLLIDQGREEAGRRLITHAAEEGDEVAQGWLDSRSE